MRQRRRLGSLLKVGAVMPNPLRMFSMGECKLRGLAKAQRFRSLYRYSRVEAELNSRNGKLGACPSNANFLLGQPSEGIFGVESGFSNKEVLSREGQGHYSERGIQFGRAIWAMTGRTFSEATRVRLFSGHAFLH